MVSSSRGFVEDELSLFVEVQLSLFVEVQLAVICLRFEDDWGENLQVAVLWKGRECVAEVQVTQF